MDVLFQSDQNFHLLFSKYNLPKQIIRRYVGFIIIIPCVLKYTDILIDIEQNIYGGNELTPFVCLLYFLPPIYDLLLLLAAPPMSN